MTHEFPGDRIKRLGAMAEKIGDKKLVAFALVTELVGMYLYRSVPMDMDEALASTEKRIISICRSYASVRAKKRRGTKLLPARRQS